MRAIERGRLVYDSYRNVGKVIHVPTSAGGSYHVQIADAGGRVAGNGRALLLRSEFHLVPRSERAQAQALYQQVYPEAAPRENRGKGKRTRRAPVPVGVDTSSPRFAALYRQALALGGPPAPAAAAAARAASYFDETFGQEPIRDRAAIDWRLRVYVDEEAQAAWRQNPVTEAPASRRLPLLRLLSRKLKWLSADQKRDAAERTARFYDDLLGIDGSTYNLDLVRRKLQAFAQEVRDEELPALPRGLAANPRARRRAAR